MADENLLPNLSAYADGELGAPERKRAEDALAADPALARTLRVYRTLDRAAASLSAPQISDADWAPPVVSAEQLDSPAAREIDAAARSLPVHRLSDEAGARLFAQIAQRTARRDAVPQAAPAVRASFKRVHSRRWSWVAALAAAAMVTIGLAVQFWQPAEEDDLAAVEIPEMTDDRCDVRVKYVEGQREPVVSYVLKDPRPSEETESHTDWRWMPY